MLLHLLAPPDPVIGYGVHALNLQRELSALAARGCFLFQFTDLTQEVALQPLLDLIAAVPEGLPVVNLLLGDGRSSHQILDHLPGRRVINTVFESDTLPLGWSENLQRSDLVLTASRWGADILRLELPTTPVAVVPEGVDPQLHHQWNRPTDRHPWRRDADLQSPLEDCFRVLCVGKYETRKSYAERLRLRRPSHPRGPRRS
ncbi:MAG: hypothetical protein VKI83_03555, partial [Synechococcaceae cyanobacterium]|nr:hypothetical protein [Synechococcaceae cyanobacterium]